MREVERRSITFFSLVALAELAFGRATSACQAIGLKLGGDTGERLFPTESLPKLRDTIPGMWAFGMQGVNLTLPHKVSVIEHLDEIAPGAAIIGVVNTVRREADRLIGENTDGKGFLRGVRADAGIDPMNKRVVFLGAGGAARAIVTELALAGAADVLVVHCSLSRGEQMVADLVSKTKGANQVRAMAGYLWGAWRHQTDSRNLEAEVKFIF